MRLGGEGRLLRGKRTSGFRFDCLLGVNETELLFGLGTRIAL
jgi:hypothetical protein